MFSQTIGVYPFFFAGGKVSEIDQEKTISHKKPHRQESYRDVSFAGHDILFFVGKCSHTKLTL
jgi:hypothetical protein